MSSQSLVDNSDVNKSYYKDLSPEEIQDNDYIEILFQINGYVTQSLLHKHRMKDNVHKENDLYLIPGHDLNKMIAVTKCY